MSKALKLRLVAVGVSGALLAGAAMVVAVVADRALPEPERSAQPAAIDCPSPGTAGADGVCEPLPTNEPLRRLAERRGIRLGSAVDVTALQTNPRYRKVLAREFAALTPESAMKWGVVEPSRGNSDYRAADELVGFAREHEQEVYGHTLVWHRQVPTWLDERTMSTGEVRGALRDRVWSQTSRYRGAVWAWDVVNEPLDDSGGLRDSIWSRKLGEGYIADAFRWARAADPGAKLYLNDYNIEGINPKSDALYDLVRRLLADGVPIDGVGFQTHWNLRPLPENFVANLRRFAALGVDVAITELDVSIPLPASPESLRQQAEIYASAVDACLAVDRCVALTVWGFTDAYSWVPVMYPGNGAAGLYDANLTAKPAHRAVVAALTRRRAG